MRPAGLSSDEARARLARHGPNEIPRAAATPAWRMFLRHLQGPLNWLLIAAAAICVLTQAHLDAAAIASILLLNAIVGFVQEHRAERAVHALRSLTAPRARVVRDGRLAVVPARELVPGDVLALEAGDIVAADARILEANALAANESALTGESVPAEKSARRAAPDAPLAERHDSVFMGSSIVRGTGHALIEATGMATQMGLIAKLLETATSGVTPLTLHVRAFSRALVIACVGLVAFVFLAGVLRGEPLLEMLLASISLAVAAVPEGLPAVVTIALAVGVQRLAARNVIVRRMSAVETLGCTTVICTDKTGTLTTGVMAVRDIWGRDRHAILDAAAACCDAEIRDDGDVGDPTEIALLRGARERGIEQDAIERERPRVATRPFDPETRRMSVLRADGVLYEKGAVESILERCATGTDGALEAARDMASRGLRVLAIATGRGAEAGDARQLALLGVVGLADPPRSEAIEAIAAARRAGITTVMITGDHAQTALAIASEMKLLRPGDDAGALVHARVTPEEKLAIVREWKGRGAIVAMTGDGVNDAPALREAHVGIAMGRSGTEVTREAADVVLADDNYASIVAGIREGRGIYENIRKTIVYLLTGNAGELALVLGTVLAGLPLPLLPLQLLWINLVTDGLPALALATDPADRRILDAPPRSPRTRMLGGAEWRSIAVFGALDAAATMAVFAWALDHRSLEHARALAFSTLVFVELFRSFAARSPTHVFWEVGPLTNFRLLLVVVASALLQVGLHAFAPTQQLLGAVALPLHDLALAVGVGLVPVSVLEISKLVRRAVAGRDEQAPA